MYVCGNTRLVLAIQQRGEVCLACPTIDHDPADDAAQPNDDDDDDVGGVNDVRVCVAASVVCARRVCSAGKKEESTQAGIRSKAHRDMMEGRTCQDTARVLRIY